MVSTTKQIATAIRNRSCAPWLKLLVVCFLIQSYAMSRKSHREDTRSHLTLRTTMWHRTPVPEIYSTTRSNNDTGYWPSLKPQTVENIFCKVIRSQQECQQIVLLQLIPPGKSYRQNSPSKVCPQVQRFYGLNLRSAIASQAKHAQKDCQRQDSDALQGC